MSALEERVKLSRLVNSKDLVDFYQKNTNLMYSKYLESSEDCKSIDKSDIRTGGFYFLHYLDDSNWM
jgi:hypothetical protein